MMDSVEDSEFPSENLFIELMEVKRRSIWSWRKNQMKKLNPRAHLKKVAKVAARLNLDNSLAKMSPMVKKKTIGRARKSWSMRKWRNFFDSIP